jgi:xylulokinase
MPFVLGIDLGTQSAKTVVLDDRGAVRAVTQAEIPILTPRPGWAEQEPQAWWRAVCDTVQAAVAEAGIRASDIAAVGLSGQMHGTVCVDQEGHPVRPAVIWADARSGAEVDALLEQVGRERLAALTANPLAAGFMAATVAWLRRHESETLWRTRSLLLPKDYIRLRLTRQIATDASDAAGTLLFDVANRCWSQAMIEAVGVRPELLPRVVESGEVCGTVTRRAAQDTGIPAGTPVVAGGGDQPVGALAAGAIEPGILLATIGTGGQIFAPLAEPVCDPELRTHTFCHALPDRWYAMGAILSAGLCLRWLRDQVFVGSGLGYAAMAAEAEAVPPGAEGLCFLPYLAGERTPHMDPGARGLFLGLSLRHRRGHLVRAVMEGVAFALREALDVLRSLGVAAERTVALGGGLRSPLWRQILADVFAAPIESLEIQEPAALGAAMLAADATPGFPGIARAAELLARPAGSTSPIGRNTDGYRERYAVYRSLYPRLKDIAREGGRPS